MSALSRGYTLPTVDKTLVNFHRWATATGASLWGTTSPWGLRGGGKAGGRKGKWKGGMEGERQVLKGNCRIEAYLHSFPHLLHTSPYFPSTPFSHTCLLHSPPYLLSLSLISPTHSTYTLSITLSSTCPSKHHLSSSPHLSTLLTSPHLSSPPSLPLSRLMSQQRFKW